MNNKKIIIIAVIAVIVIGAGAFYGGMIYQKNSLAAQGLLRGGNVRGNFQGGANGQRGQGGQGGQRMGGQNGSDGSFVNGEIISKDDKSVTVKTNDGGSKIIYFSDTTQIGKAVQGMSGDLGVGQQIMVNGKTNSDGSLTANNIQVRPAQAPVQ